MLWSRSHRQTNAAAPEPRAQAFASLASATANNNETADNATPAAPTGTIYDGIAAVVPQADVADAVYDEYAPTKFFETSTGLLQAAPPASKVEQIQSSRLYWFDLTEAEAGYRNILGIFKVDDANGNILRNDGKWLLADEPGVLPPPGSNLVFDPTAYRAAALARSQVVFSEGPGKKLVPGGKRVMIPEDWNYFSYYLHQNGNSTHQNEGGSLDKVGHKWFAFDDVNEDGFKHFRYNADGSIEIEDLSPVRSLNPWLEARDADYDDVVFNFTALRTDVIVIAFVGETQSVDDKDTGMSQITNKLRAEGYDVYLFDEDDVGNDFWSNPSSGADSDAPLENINVTFQPRPVDQWESMQAVKDAILNRGIRDIAIIGYSHGGGAGYMLSEAMAQDPTLQGKYDLKYTAYIDAVKKGSTAAETKLPVNSAVHYNVYQSLVGGYLNFLPGQFPVEGDDVNGATNDNVDINDLANGFNYGFPFLNGVERRHTNRLGVGGRAGIAETEAIQDELIRRLKLELP